MHASMTAFAPTSGNKKRCLRIFESTLAITIELQDVEKEGIKTKPCRGLNQDRRMSHMGSTSIPNDHPMGLCIGLVRPFVEGNRGMVGRHFLSRRTEHTFAEWLIGRRGNILKCTCLPVVTGACLWQPSG